LKLIANVCCYQVIGKSHSPLRHGEFDHKLCVIASSLRSFSDFSCLTALLQVNNAESYTTVQIESDFRTTVQTKEGTSQTKMSTPREQMHHISSHPLLHGA
jgi:hypothetical protein